MLLLYSLKNLCKLHCFMLSTNKISETHFDVTYVKACIQSGVAYNGIIVLPVCMKIGQ